MQKGLIFPVLLILTVILASCSTPPPPPDPVPVPVPVPVELPPPPVQPTLFDEMQTLTAATLDAGGLAAIGIAESKSLDLALNLAKKNSRIELAKILKIRIETLALAFSEETGIPYDSLSLSGFNAATKAIIRYEIVDSVAQSMKYEVSDDTTVTAYAFMELSPKIIIEQLTQETELYARLQNTQAFKTFSAGIETYDAFKAAQK